MHGSTIGRIRSAIVGLLLLLVTWRSSCNGLQYQSAEAYANGDDCALILASSGRTNAFDYTYNLLRGSFPPSAGSQSCITYDAVNRAYIEARKRINVAQPKGKTWRPEDLATVGELLLDISTNLAHTYGLTYEEVEKSLPLIDTSKTLIREVCPAYLSDVECRAGKYRRNDGLCTNLRNPTWGATLSPFQRLLTPRFSDGLSAPRISVTGHDLPLSRIVSRTMHPDEGYHDHAGTVMVIAWGQFMDHDYTLTGTPLDPLNRNDPEECCHRPPHLKNPYCNEILIPEDDYFYRLFNVKCMDFVRAFPAVRPGCRLGSRVPFNLLTGVLDGNTVYGITETFARKLRTGYGGLLRMNPVFSEYGLKDLLPLKLDIPDEGCTRPNRSMYCFEAGEIRVNEQLVLTCMHTLMAREHNRIAKQLNQINPHWDDETLFQEARRIVIAEIQHITYNEFLPILLGKDVMEKFGLLLEKNSYWDGYDDSVNPAVIDAFASAAFRFGHSLLPTAVERWSKAHKFIASKRLSDLIRRPYDLYRAGVFDEYIMGLMNQVAQAMDDSITQEVTNHLFKKAGAKFGLDLVSFNMQRGREFGIPSYMEFRKFCGLPWADTFEELFGSMPNETIRRYSSIFEHPADVDLWSGGVSERPLPGSMLGPTFACVIATQFSYSRRGDRFWYELPNQPSSFTLEQLNEIRKIKLARVICDNTDLIDTIQIYPMVLPDHEINPRVPCRSGILPSMDLTKWAEYPTHNHAQYSTENDRSKNTFSSDSRRNPERKLSKGIRGKKKQSKSAGTENDPKLLSGAHDTTTSPTNAIKINGNDSNNALTRYLSKNLSELSNNTNLNSNLASDVSKVVNLIRQRAIEEFEASNKLNFNGQEKGIVVDRSKRSLNERSDHVGPKKRVPSTDRFYRHPNLSYEEQKRLSGKYLSEAMNLNFDGVRNNGVLNSVNSSRPTFRMKYPFVGSRKHSYLPIFSKCNDTDEDSWRSDKKSPSASDAAIKSSINNENHSKNTTIEEDHSEVEDLNRPALVIQKKLDESEENEDSTWPKMSEDSKILLEEKSESSTESQLSLDHSIVSTSIDEQKNNRTYVNIQDIQEKVNETEGNPVYDPAKIPYVDVPDYSDIREESLDEQDRQANRGKIQKDVDSVDPGVVTDLEKNVEASSGGESKKSKGDTILKDLGKYLGGERNQLKENSRDDKSVESEEPSEPSKDSGSADKDKIFQYVKKDPTEEKSGHSSELMNDPEENSGRNEGRESEEDSKEKWREESTTERLEPIVFDINEYKRPFNLDEFLKDDPIMKKLELLGKETRAIYGESRKRVPGFFNESESDNASRGWSVEREDPEERLDYFPSHASNFGDTYARTNDNERSNKYVTKKNGKDYNTDDFLSSLFSDDGRKGFFSRFGNGADFLSRFSMDGGSKYSQDDSSFKGNSK
ncbi:uncharacterized protein LOC128889548 isoform X1 [Hylaeus anthracinus]|uniref:uncharacterized protein LOC128889548 isoform X1 n=1 Tax=Hylaeus anthracinus TaxID=313031 RepID=UPI0023B8C515|nr:uncharacterized protein LOC128889548 isoform X1 [Hylaeus anthracinus]